MILDLPIEDLLAYIADEASNHPGELFYYSQNGVKVFLYVRTSGTILRAELRFSDEEDTAFTDWSLRNNLTRATKILPPKLDPSPEINLKISLDK